MKGLERAGKGFLDRLVGFAGGPGQPERAIDPSEVRTVLVVRPHNQMGDMLLGTPLFAALRKGFSRSQITLVASPDNYEIMLGHPDVDNLLVFDKKEFQRHPAKALAFWRSLRGTPWDVVVVPTTVSFSVTSAILAWLASGRVRVGSDGGAYGRRMGRAVFHVHVPCRWDREHQSERNLDFARALGMPVSIRSPSMGLSREEESWARGRVAASRDRGGKLIGIHPGAGKLPNRWPVERFAEVAGLLAQDPRNHVFVVVGPREGALVDATRRLTGDVVTYLSDLTLRQAAALIGEFDLLLCNDTGVMHIGAALGTPTLALFGPTDPELWAPLAAATHWLRGSNNRIGSLGVQAVYARLLGLLEAGTRTGEENHAPQPSSC